MKKIVVLIIVVTILIVSVIAGVCFALYKEEQENKRLDLEAVTLKENLSVEFGKEVRVSSFIENLNGTIVNDFKIDTEKLGDIKVLFEYINIKNRKRTAEFTIKTIDVNPPKIFIGNTYSVEVGYNKNLIEVLLSGDDIDDNPTREIIGEYDFNTVGNYNLVYVVTDASNNQTKKEFVLQVTEKSKPNKTTTVANNKRLPIEDVIKNHKNENTKIGIDVSRWQQDIDFEKVKNAGVEFVIIRLGYQTDYDGDYELDPYFVTNIEGAKKAGLPVGIYFYSYARTTNQAINQANWVKDNLKNYEIDLPIAFDWESWNSFNKTNMSFFTINKVANTFLDTLEQEGYKGMLYSSKNYLEKIWYPTKHETWLAQYNVEPTYNGEYTMWQMSDSGKVEGINGNVDIDILYLDKIK